MFCKCDELAIHLLVYQKLFSNFRYRILVSLEKYLWKVFQKASPPIKVLGLREVNIKRPPLQIHPHVLNLSTHDVSIFALKRSYYNALHIVLKLKSRVNSFFLLLRH